MALTDAIEFMMPGLAPKAQNPNAREHWTKQRGKLAESTKYAMDALLLASAAIPPGSGCPWSHARLVLTQRAVSPRDVDNFFASWKPALDGCVRAGIIEDDGWRTLPSVMVVTERVAHKLDQCVHVRFEKVEA
jgi:hypothetical protein